MTLNSLLAGASALSLLAATSALAEVALAHIGSIKSEAAGEGAAEIVDYDPASKRLFISNAAGSVDIVDIADPKAPKNVARIDTSPYGGGVNNSAVKIAGFTAWNDKGAPAGARIGKPGVPFAKDVEPEYVAISPDSK